MISSNHRGVYNNTVLSTSTYSSDFSFPTTRGPVKRFQNYVSFVLDTPDKLVPRCFPHFALHVSPHRILEYERSDIGFGAIPAEHGDGEELKEITEETIEDHVTENIKEKIDESCDTLEHHFTQEETQYIPEQEEKITCEYLPNGEDLKESENMKESECKEKSIHCVEEVTRNIYKSTARKAGEECPLPLPARPVVLPDLIGKNEDKELYHSVARRYGTWKTSVVPRAWERDQVRPLCEGPKTKQYCPSRIRFCNTKTRLLDRRQQKANEVAFTMNDERTQSSPSYELHVRPSPGYGGYVPKLPLIPRPPRDYRLMMTTYDATYGGLYRDELKVHEYAHKSPFSKLLTTTTPCNPFNKLTQMSSLTSGLFAV